MYRAMWEAAMDDMIASLLYESSPSRFKYIAEYDRWVNPLTQLIMFIKDCQPLCCADW